MYGLIVKVLKKISNSHNDQMLSQLFWREFYFYITFVGHNLKDTKLLIKFLIDDGKRIPQEDMPGCPSELYEIMLMCWEEDPRQRPGFFDLHDMLDQPAKDLAIRRIVIGCFYPIRLQNRSESHFG